MKKPVAKILQFKPKQIEEAPHTVLVDSRWIDQVNLHYDLIGLFLSHINEGTAPREIQHEN